MRFLFAPAIGLLNHLRYSAKFSLVAVIAVVAFGYLLYSKIDSASQNVAFAEDELRGLQVVQPFLKTIVLMQQHRGLSAGVLNGNEGMRSALTDKSREVAESMKAVEAAIAGPGKTYGVNAQWQEVQGAWSRLAVPAGLQLSAKDSFAQHTAMIAILLRVLEDVGDMSKLMLDPESNTYYLIEPMIRSGPEVTERLGRLRARGNGILSKRELTEADRYDIIHQLGELNHVMEQLSDRIRRAGKFNPSVQQQAERQLQAQQQSHQKVVQVIRDEILSQRFGMEPKAYFALTTDAIGIALKTIDEILVPLTREGLQARKDRDQQEMWMAIVVSVLLVAIAGYFSLAIWMVVMQSVSELEEGARHVAQGDLTHQIHFSADDELKEVAQQFNRMVQEFAQLVRQIQSSSERVHGAARTLTTSAQEVATSSEAQSDAASQMAAAMEEMTVGVSHISDNANTAEEISASSGHLSEQGGDIVARSVEEMFRIAEAVQQSAQAIRELGDQTSQISLMVNSIKEIADQTNLLALNAAIEAARAGESGRGFAVVADEVRKLAERTAKATQEITAMVNSIQGGTARAVDAMESSVGRVHEGVELTREAGNAMAQIRDGARSVVATVGDISVALREQASASTDIVRNVENIARMAEQNTGAVRRTAGTARELEAMIEELGEKVRRFKV